MAANECHLCKRDISKPALVRCHDERCPLKKAEARAPIGTVAGIGGVGVLLLGAVALLGWHWTASPAGQSESGGLVVTARGLPHAPAAASATNETRWTPSGTSDGAPAPGGGSGNWLGWLFSVPKAAPQPAQAPVDDAVLNARAPSRVQNFSCGGRLSPAQLAVCSNWSLAVTDYNLAILYRNILAGSADPQALRRDYAAWLARMGKLTGDAAAIERQYAEWRERLERDKQRQ